MVRLTPSNSKLHRNETEMFYRISDNASAEEIKEIMAINMNLLLPIVGVCSTLLHNSDDVYFMPVPEDFNFDIESDTSVKWNLCSGTQKDYLPQYVSKYIDTMVIESPDITESEICDHIDNLPYLTISGIPDGFWNDDFEVEVPTMKPFRFLDVGVVFEDVKMGSMFIGYNGDIPKTVLSDFRNVLLSVYYQHVDRKHIEFNGYCFMVFSSEIMTLGHVKENPQEHNRTDCYMDANGDEIPLNTDFSNIYHLVSLPGRVIEECGWLTKGCIEYDNILYEDDISNAVRVFTSTSRGVVDVSLGRDMTEFAIDVSNDFYFNALVDIINCFNIKGMVYKLYYSEDDYKPSLILDKCDIPLTDTLKDELKETLRLSQENVTWLVDDTHPINK